METQTIRQLIKSAEHNIGLAHNIYKIEKALPTGTRRENPDGSTRVKQEDGSWKRETSPKDKKQEEKKPEGEKPKEEESKNVQELETLEILQDNKAGQQAHLLGIKIKSQDTETIGVMDKDGKTVLEKNGDKNTIRLDIDDIRKMANQEVFSHNHPSGISFSPEDIATAKSVGMKEIRAYGKDGSVYSMSNIKPAEMNWEEDNFTLRSRLQDSRKTSLDVHRDINKPVRDYMFKNIKAGNITNEEAGKIDPHITMIQYTKKLGYTYKFKLADKWKSILSKLEGEVE